MRHDVLVSFQDTHDAHAEPVRLCRLGYARCIDLHRRETRYGRIPEIHIPSEFLQLVDHFPHDELVGQACAVRPRLEVLRGSCDQHVRRHQPYTVFQGAPVVNPLTGIVVFKGNAVHTREFLDRSALHAFCKDSLQRHGHMGVRAEFDSEPAAVFLDANTAHDRQSLAERGVEQHDRAGAVPLYILDDLQNMGVFFKHAPGDLGKRDPSVDDPFLRIPLKNLRDSFYDGFLNCIACGQAVAASKSTDQIEREIFHLLFPHGIKGISRNMLTIYGELPKHGVEDVFLRTDQWFRHRLADFIFQPTDAVRLFLCRQAVESALIPVNVTALGIIRIQPVERCVAEPFHHFPVGAGHAELAAHSLPIGTHQIIPRWDQGQPGGKAAFQAGYFFLVFQFKSEILQNLLGTFHSVRRGTLFSPCFPFSLVHLCCLLFLPRS